MIFRNIHPERRRGTEISRHPFRLIRTVFKIDVVGNYKRFASAFRQQNPEPFRQTRRVINGDKRKPVKRAVDKHLPDVQLFQTFHQRKRRISRIEPDHHHARFSESDFVKRGFFLRQKHGRNMFFKTALRKPGQTERRNQDNPGDLSLFCPFRHNRGRPLLCRQDSCPDQSADRAFHRAARKAVFPHQAVP